MFIIKSERGLTMVELMIGLLIMVILIVAVISVGKNAVTKSRNVSTMNDLKVYVSTAERYMVTESGKGLSEDGFNENLEGTYIFEDGKSIKKNSWKNPYILHMVRDTTVNTPGMIIVTSYVDEVYNVVQGEHGDMDGSVYYFRGKTASCLTKDSNLNEEELEDIFNLFGNQVVGFMCGDIPISNK